MASTSTGVDAVVIGSGPNGLDPDGSRPMPPTNPASTSVEGRVIGSWS